MASFTHHIFVCGNTREPGHKRGSCAPDGKQTLKDAFKVELKRRGVGATTRANHAGCLDQCEHGPVVVVYPTGIWYGRVTPEDVPRIVEKTILGGEILGDLVIDESCLNNPGCPHRLGPREAS
ncbi:(2Fe-2S) ferredoxin domain-containing protein [Aquisphaera insulae]|uniref:(2Fe-2S) ferredoxin domain-containing protein n=1 Tax=Aquisphaera insulae TaxID=2712864 RepID=UPI0013EA8C89|nr:(2Fe-2S) ferredoxin domain-containing protein [Aquisphaera insulae]